MVLLISISIFFKPREAVNAQEGFTIMNKLDFRNKVVEMFSSDNFSKDISIMFDLLLLY